MPAVRTILIVDDDAALRRSLAEQLELHAEFASRECDTGAAALRLARRWRRLTDGGAPWRGRDRWPAALAGSGEARVSAQGQHARGLDGSHPGP